MRYYELKVVIREGSDEFWEALEAENKSGVDDIQYAVRELLADWDAEVTVAVFNHD